MNKYQTLLAEAVDADIRSIALMPDAKRYELAAEYWRAMYGPGNIWEPITEMHRLEDFCALVQDALGATLGDDHHQAVAATVRMNAALLGGLMAGLYDPLQDELDAAHQRRTMALTGGNTAWA